jgi:2,3-bisphosphoglycerate-dependent phosphoglycerate mutase
VPTSVVFETHSVTEDNERGTATGWLPGRLSRRGRELAVELGERRRSDGLAAVVASDLARARETVELALAGADVPLLYDWRLRECNYGALNGAPSAEVVAKRVAHLHEPYPGGESWNAATTRCTEALDDIARRWAGGRVLVVGHIATRLALEVAAGRDLAALLVEEFVWRPGWEHTLTSGG